MQDVNGINLWGGRTYVRGQGYQWLDDHARIEHVGYAEVAPRRIRSQLRWCDPAGGTLLDERRTMSAELIEGGWRLRVEYTLTNPGLEPVRLGSPGTNGRPGDAGYGGFFWRGALDANRVASPHSTREAEVNGSMAEWVELAGPAYTLVFSGLGEGDRWFVRLGEYPGVCVALAFADVRSIEPGDCLRRAHEVRILDM